MKPYSSFVLPPLLISRLMLLLTLTTAMQAQDYIYTTNNGSITLTGYASRSNPVALVIPSTITGLPVTGIGANACNGSGSVIKVTIPNSVSRIGFGAFYQCENLASRGSVGQRRGISALAWSWRSRQRLGSRSDQPELAMAVSSAHSVLAGEQAKG